MSAGRLRVVDGHTIDRSTGEVVSEITPAQAQNLTDKIGHRMQVVWKAVVDAYKLRAWAALGYDNWTDYWNGELGGAPILVPGDERSDVFDSLRSSGLSLRAIATVTGTSKDTVARDLSAGVSNETPAVTGRDGKQYAATQDRTGEAGSTPDLSGAPSDPENVEASSADDAAGTAEANGASERDDTGSGPASDPVSPQPETPLELVERAGRARLGTHDLINHVNPADLAAALDLDGLASWDLSVDAMRRWIDTYTAARVPKPLEIVR